VSFLSQAQRRAQDGIRVFPLREAEGSGDGIDGLVHRGVIRDAVVEEELREAEAQMTGEVGVGFTPRELGEDRAQCGAPTNLCSNQVA
jgi:hypothetical protein